MLAPAAAARHSYFWVVNLERTGRKKAITNMKEKEEKAREKIRKKAIVVEIVAFTI